MNFLPSSQQDHSLDLTPLIDVVFILLIFFAVSTSFQSETGLNVNLPKAKTGSSQTEKNELRVTISEEGSVALDGKTDLSPEDLRREFRAAHERNSETVVLVVADERASHGSVVRVMDLARQANLQRLAIATSEELSKESDALP